MTRIARLHAMAARVVPPGVGLGVCAVGGTADLRPVEAMATLEMVPSRRAEFAAGRRAARLAMRAAALPCVEVPMGPDRAPVWPARVSGSISHADNLAIAVCAGAGWRGLGVDLECDAPADPDLAAIVLTQAEADLPPRLVFCLKEAAYKAQYPISRRLLDFDALEIALDGASFTARFRRAEPPFAVGDAINGRYLCDDGLILALAWID